MDREIEEPRSRTAPIRFWERPSDIHEYAILGELWLVFSKQAYSRAIFVEQANQRYRIWHVMGVERKLDPGKRGIEEPGVG